MYFVKTPQIFRSIYPELVWLSPNANNEIYLSFDDGPMPGATDWVLDTLKEFGAKASFFCVGSNIEKHPSLFQRIIDEGHTVGSHSYSHLSGWKTKHDVYIDDVNKAGAMTNTNLFRPPYGRIKKAQAKDLSKDYKIIMWDILSGDFDQKVSAQQCIDNVLKNSRSGSIVVFHDNLKSLSKLKAALPSVLEKLLAKGYVLSKL